MIDPKELRISNWVLFKGKPKQVVAIDSSIELDGLVGSIKVKLWLTEKEYVYQSAWARSFDPIPLTPEWLERMGFVNNREGSLQYSGAFDLFEYNEDGVYWFNYDSNQVGIQYVHQLQNLYFFLTGEEIEIK